MGDALCRLLYLARNFKLAGSDNRSHGNSGCGKQAGSGGWLRRLRQSALGHVLAWSLRTVCPRAKIAANFALSARLCHKSRIKCRDVVVRQLNWRYRCLFLSKRQKTAVSSGLAATRPILARWKLKTAVGDASMGDDL